MPEGQGAPRMTPVERGTSSGDGTITRAVRDLSVEEREKVLHWVPWRVGKTVGRLIFACVDPEDIDGVSDPLIGDMNTATLAEEAVSAHNAALRRVDA